MNAPMEFPLRTEGEWRAEIVEVARKWIGTPYLSNGMIVGAGVDCAMILVAVYRAVGIVPEGFDPRPYPPMWHIHQADERYRLLVERFAQSVPGPPARPSRPGDVVIFRIGRCYAHGGIITEWPRIIHARAPGAVWEEDVSQDCFGKHALWRAPRLFYTPWPFAEDDHQPSLAGG
jgi:cell wall-associated NlpC family hydrolase